MLFCQLRALIGVNTRRMSFAHACLGLSLTAGEVNGMVDIMPATKGNGRLADHEDSPPRQPRFSFGYLPCAGTSEKSTDSLGAPTHTQPGGFIDGTGFFSRFRSIIRDDR
jgi:hypothetical protein